MKKINKPFNIGDKVKCIKKGRWHLAAGLGDESKSKVPVFGCTYTVSYIGRIENKDNLDNNGVEWAMTLEEFPEDEPTNEPHNIFSCRRFIKV